MSQHRRGEIKVRKYIPDSLRRREGAHFVRTKFEPTVCGDCGGHGHTYDPRNSGDHPVQCPTCEGDGEV